MSADEKPAGAVVPDVHCKLDGQRWRGSVMFLGGRGRFPDGMHAPGTVLDHRYRLGTLLGEGGMAIVYRAHDEALDRDVAVKILRSQFASDKDFVRRFRQEARNAASLSHPAIAPVFDTGVLGDQQYIVMQLVDGPDLERVLSERGRLPVSEALRIASDVADALQAAHDAGIVHRDVKPANILLTSNGEVRVVDFGIARALGDSRTTQAGLLLGSVQYCSPEQVTGDPVSPASDVYSLGVVLYELLTGRRPFDGPEPVAVALQRVRVDPVPPSEVAPDLSPEIDRLVLRALQRLPADRYPSAKAFGEAIRRYWRTAHPRSAAADRPRLIVPTIARASTRVPVPAQIAADARRGGGPRNVHRARAEDARGYRRRRALPLLLIPAAALLFVMIVLSPLIGAVLGQPGAVLGETGRPEASAAAALSTAGRPEARSLNPTATPSPSAVPSPSPTPLVATPRPTPSPTSPPVVKPPAADSPTVVVARFYDLVEDHKFDAAATLWTSRMRHQYPPDGYIDGRFSRTTRIDLRRDELIAFDAGSGTAVVAVDLLEYRTDGPSPRRFIGRWEMILTADGWKMDEPHF